MMTGIASQNPLAFTPSVAVFKAEAAYLVAWSMFVVLQIDVCEKLTSEQMSLEERDSL